VRDIEQLDELLSSGVANGDNMVCGMETSFDESFSNDSEPISNA
jgi:hypothetical protein